MKYVILTDRPWYRDMTAALQASTGRDFYFIGSRTKLTADHLRELNPRYVFIPHWSTKIPEEIYERFECVIFHMTNLPFGRGGSPLQNLIARGIYDTKISALRCVREMDAGPIYLKRDFYLEGSAEEIFIRAAKVITEMIEHMVRHEPVPVEQTGPVVTFKRRKPEESDISKLAELKQVYDHIRMLDADGYPYSFLETKYLRFEFRRAVEMDNCVIANVCITKKRP